MVEELWSENGALNWQEEKLTDLHGQGESVDDDEDEDAVLKAPWRDEPPDLVLEADTWNVATLRFHLQREFDTLPL